MNWTAVVRDLRVNAKLNDEPARICYSDGAPNDAHSCRISARVLRDLADACERGYKGDPDG